MALGSARFINALDLGSAPCVNMYGSNIPFATKIKSLGMLLSPTLSWREHVSQTCNKVFRALYQLRLNGRYLAIPLKVQLVTTLILPYFDYCCLVILDISKEEDTRLQRALNACVRFIFSIRRDVHITPYLNRLGWLKLNLRRNYFLGVFLYKLFLYHKPLSLFEQFTPLSSHSSRSTRAAPDSLVIPKHRTSVYGHSFLVTATKYWNSLPSEVKISSTVSSFKDKLHKFLLAQQLDSQPS